MHVEHELRQRRRQGTSLRLLRDELIAGSASMGGAATRDPARWASAWDAASVGRNQPQPHDRTRAGPGPRPTRARSRPTPACTARPCRPRLQARLQRSRTRRYVLCARLFAGAVRVNAASAGWVRRRLRRRRRPRLLPRRSRRCRRICASAPRKRRPVRVLQAALVERARGRDARLPPWPAHRCAAAPA